MGLYKKVNFRYLFYSSLLVLECHRSADLLQKPTQRLLCVGGSAD